MEWRIFCRVFQGNSRSFPSHFASNKCYVQLPPHFNTFVKQIENQQADGTRKAQNIHGVHCFEKLWFFEKKFSIITFFLLVKNVSYFFFKKIRKFCQKM